MKAGTECWRNIKMPENEIRRIIKEEMYNFIEDAYTKLKNYSIFSDDGDNSPRPYTITDVFGEWLKEYKNGER